MQRTNLNVLHGQKTRHRPYALWIGVIESHKRPLDVLELASALPEMDFLMIGAPNDRRIVDRLVTAKLSNLQYLGSVSDRLKADLIRKCSVGITTSRYEGFGWTPFEFLAAHKPVLARPINVFKEIYGNSLIYASNAGEFTQHLRILYRTGFQFRIDKDAIQEFRNTYNFTRAASSILGEFGRSFTILARDLPLNSELIMGAYLVSWSLWRALVDRGDHVRIISDGSKFTTRFGLLGQTLLVGRSLMPLKTKHHALNESNNLHDKACRKISNLILLLLEPLCFVEGYAKNRKAMPSGFILAGDESQLFAAVILKWMLDQKIVFLLHDARFYGFIWSSPSLLQRIWYLLFTHCLNYVDNVVVVSKTTRTELCTFYSHPERISLLWEGSENEVDDRGEVDRLGLVAARDKESAKR